MIIILDLVKFFFIWSVTCNLITFIVLLYTCISSRWWRPDLTISLDGTLSVWHWVSQIPSTYKLQNTKYITNYDVINLQIFYTISHITTKEVRHNGAFVAKEISKKVKFTIKVAAIANKILLRHILYRVIS